MRLFHPLLACLGAGILAGCAAAPPSARPQASPEMLEALERAKVHFCNPYTAAFLEAAGVVPGRITSLQYGNRISSGESASLIGFDAYVGLSDTPNAVLVLRLGRNCAVLDSQPTGGARVSSP